MARLVFGLNQSLDGFVDHRAFAPDPPLFRHFIDQQRDLTDSLDGGGCTSRPQRHPDRGGPRNRGAAVE
jgi:hypothetical protein